MSEERRARILKNVDNMRKARCTTIIRVGNHISVHKLAIFGHQMKFGLCIIRTQATEFCHIVVIHTNYIVELIKIPSTNWSRYMSNMVTTLVGEIAHTVISRLTLMIRYEACRIDDEIILCLILLYYMTEDSLSHRRTAYIAEAYKKNTFHRDG